MFLLYSVQFIFPVTFLRLICNQVAGGWNVVGDLYEARPPSLPRLAHGGEQLFNDPAAHSPQSEQAHLGTFCEIDAGAAFSLLVC